MRGRQSATLAQCAEGIEEEPTVRVDYFADQPLGEDRTQVTEVPWFVEPSDCDFFVVGFDEDQPTKELRAPWLPPETLPLFPRPEHVPEGADADNEPAVTCVVPCVLEPSRVRPNADVSFQELVSVWRERSVGSVVADDPDPTAIEELALLVFPPVPAPEPRRFRWSLGLLTLLLALAGLLAFGVLCLRPQAWARSGEPTRPSAHVVPDAQRAPAGVPVMVTSTEAAPSCGSATSSAPW